MRDVIASRAAISHNAFIESCDTVLQVVSIALRHQGFMFKAEEQMYHLAFTICGFEQLF